MWQTETVLTRSQRKQLNKLGKQYAKTITKRTRLLKQATKLDRKADSLAAQMALVGVEPGVVRAEAALGVGGGDREEA